MYSSYFIAKRNLKKKKGESVVLFLLIALAVLLLYTSVSVLTGIDPVLDAAYERAHTADFLFISSVEKERIREIFLEQEEVTEYERTQCLFTSGAFRADKSAEKKDYAFIIGAIEDSRKLCRLPELEQNEIGEEAVLLPYYLHSSYELGDGFYLTIGGQEYLFKVAGFVEDPLFATPLNITSYSIYITRARMEDMIAKNPTAANVAWQHKVRLNDKDTAKFDEKISPILVKAFFQELSSTSNLGVDWQSMKNGAGILSHIGMGIILVFSILLILVALMIVRFSIRNFLEQNLKNIGILQACGYTSGQLRRASLLEIGLIAFVGSWMGVVLGVVGNGIIGSIEGRMMGIRWSHGFDLGIAVLAVLSVFLVVLATAAAAGRAYAPLSVLHALRGGIHTHNFKRNYFPLEKSRLPLSLALSGKNILGEKCKSFSIFGIMTLLALTTCIGFALYENFAVKTDLVLDMAGIESGDIAVSGENLETYGAEMEAWEEIESVLFYCEMNLRLSNGERQRSVSCDIWKEPEKVNHEMLVQGRLPQYDNEVVLTTNLAKALGVDVGSVIYIEGRGERLDYLVSGIDQKINHMGIKAILTMEGLARLNGDSEATTLFLYLKPNRSIEKVLKKIERQFGDLHVSNGKQEAFETMNSVTMGVSVICIVFSAITILVVLLVEVLLIHAKLTKERKNYGIQKALGYTTRQLIWQIMLVNLPVILAGSICGVLLSQVFLNPFVLACFSMFGIEQCKLSASLFWGLVTVAGILAVALFASFAVAVRVRRIEPVQMLAED